MSLLRGLFDGNEDDLFRAFASSLEMDLWIAEEDIVGSIAHVTMLGEVGVLSSGEAATLVDGLSEILVEFRNGSWTPDDSQEDIHMAVEARLTEIVGEVGGKLHTARSRNDQVATDVRLWLMRRLGTLAAAVGDLITTLLDRVEYRRAGPVAGLHPPPAWSTDSSWPSSPRPRLGPQSRPRTDPRCDRTSRPMPARSGRTRRHTPPHQPSTDRCSPRFLRTDRKCDGCRCLERPSSGNGLCLRHLHVHPLANGGGARPLVVGGIRFHPAR